MKYLPALLLLLLLPAAGCCAQLQTGQPVTIIFKTGNTMKGTINDPPKYADPQPGMLEIELLPGSCVYVNADTIDRTEEFESMPEQGEDDQGPLSFSFAQMTPTPKPTTEVAFRASWLPALALRRGAAQAQPQPLQTGELILPGDTLELGANTRLQAQLGDVATLGLEAHSTVRLALLEYRTDLAMYRLEPEIEQGVLWLESQAAADDLEHLQLQLGALLRANPGRSLLRLERQPDGRVLIQVVSGAPVALVSIDGIQRLDLPAGRQLLVDLQDRRLNLARASNEPIAGLNELVTRWNLWVDWKPQEIALESDFVLPVAPLPTPFGMLPALGLEESLGSMRVLMPVVKADLVSDVESFTVAIERYQADTQGLPQRLEDLRVNPGVTGWAGPYLGPEQPLTDPWGQPWCYRVDTLHSGEKKWRLYSSGGNRTDEFGLGDDIP